MLSYVVTKLFPIISVLVFSPDKWSRLIGLLLTPELYDVLCDLLKKVNLVDKKEQLKCRIGIVTPPSDRRFFISLLPSEVPPIW